MARVGGGAILLYCSLGLQKVSTMADEESKNTFNPAEWLQGLQPPNIDLGQLTEAAREDFQALQKANQITLEGWQSLAQKQSELFQEAATRWQQRMSEAMSDPSSQGAGQQSDFLRKELEAAISSMREMAELAAKSQSEAMEVISQRFEEDMKLFFGQKD